MEFEFDFPFEPSNKAIQSMMNTRCISYATAYNAVYQEQWKWRRRQLQLETRCLSSMIERLLPKIKSKFWKIIVELVSTPHHATPRNLLGVCVWCSMSLIWNGIQIKQISTNYHT